MATRTIVEVKVEDVEKRIYPSKYYVYIIVINWSDGSVSVIYRRYSKFFSFQTKLLDRFPEESGRNKPEERIIPFLPGKILFGRSHIQKVALRRLKSIDVYCQTLVKLPLKISQCDLVLQFFETKPDDLAPKRSRSIIKESVDEISGPLQLERYAAIADYEKEQRNEVDLVSGMVVEVIDKTETGWWFVSVDEEQGWAPGAYLQKDESDNEEDTAAFPPGEENYAVIESYKAALSDEIELEKGTSVTVLQKSLDGWWKVRYKGREGFAPAVYLKRPDTLARSKMKNIVPSEPKPGMPTQPHFKTRKHSLAPRRRSIVIAAIKPNRPPAPQKTEYFTIHDFEDNYNKDGISFKQDQRVELIEKSDTGWWYVNIAGQEGWAPASYITAKHIGVDNKKAKPPRPQPPKKSLEISELRHGPKAELKPARPTTPAEKMDKAKVVPKPVKLNAEIRSTNHTRVNANNDTTDTRHNQARTGRSLDMSELRKKFEKFNK